VIGGVVLQIMAHIEPCPLCIFQRYAYIVTGVLALIGALHRGPYRVSRLWAGLVTLSALTGLGLAVRQVWLQHNPPAVSECGADLEFILESFPLTQGLPMVFRGTGDCSKVDWTLLGLSIAEWSTICFGVAVLCALALAADRYAGRAG
jgi:disulfide bond formation protein DsbB